MATKKRKYNEEYISYGFTVTLDRDGTEKPQYFLCGKVLANSSMKPVKLKEHLNANHPGNISDSRDTFLQKKARFEVSGTLDKYGFIPTEKPLLVASYKTAHRIAKEKKPHSIAESLIKPCALEMIEIVCGSDQRRKLEGIPMSNIVVKSRIDDISENILKQVRKNWQLLLSHLACSLMKALMFLTAVSWWVVCVILMAMKLKKYFCFGNLFWKLQRLAMYF